MIRMIASDLDKTLIGASGRLTDFSADVIRESQKAGVRWVLATAPRILDDSSDLLPFASYREDTARVMKIFVFSKFTDRIEEAKGQLADNPQIRVTSSAVWNLEVNSPVVNKARMLKKLAMELDIAEDEIMVFGDGENDISLFQNFRHSRAVSNSVPQIRNLAESVIESCDHDGVAKEIMRIRSECDRHPEKEEEYMKN